MTIFNQAMRRTFRNKIKLVVLLILPLIYILLFVIQGQNSFSIGIADKDKSVLSEKLINELSKMNNVDVIRMDETEVYDKTVSYQVDYSMIIEKNFEQKLMNGEKPQVKEFYLNNRDKFYYARNIANEFIHSMQTLAVGSNYNKAEFKQAFSEYENGKLVLLNNDSSEQSLKMQERDALGFVVMFMLYMSVITAGLMLEDRSSGVFYRVFYAPVTLFRYMAENLAAYFVVAVIQITFIIGFLNIFFGMKFGNHPLHVYLFLIVFAIFCLSFGMWLASLFKKPLGAYLTIIFLSGPLSILGGNFWSIEVMPDILQKIALFLPTTWVMIGVEKIIYDGQNFLELSLEITILLIFASIFFAAGQFKRVDIAKSE